MVKGNCDRILSSRLAAAAISLSPAYNLTPHL
jgi:hypothetical protein